MRTKALLGLAALAVSAATVMAQSSNVYSLNVVGYVNKTFDGGMYVMVGNPLKNGGNTLKELIPTPPNGTSVSRWSTALQDFDPAIPTYFTSLNTWTPNPVIAPGEGFFVVATAKFTNTFVGEVLQGTVANPVPIAGGGAYVAVANPVPVGGYISNTLAGYVPSNGDSLGLWNVGLQDFDPTIPTYFTSLGKWTPDVQIPVGDGFFLIRTGPATTWTQTFNVP